MISDETPHPLEWFIDDILLLGFPNILPLAYHTAKLEDEPAAKNSKNGSIYCVTYREAVEEECQFLPLLAVTPCSWLFTKAVLTGTVLDVGGPCTETMQYMMSLNLVMAGVHGFMLWAGLRSEGKEPIPLDRVELRRLLCFPRIFLIWSVFGAVVAGTIQAFSLLRRAWFDGDRIGATTDSLFSQRCADVIKLVLLLAAVVSFIYALKWGANIEAPGSGKTRNVVTKLSAKKR